MIRGGIQFIILLFLLFLCGNTVFAQSVPRITSISPLSGPINTLVTIKGENLGLSTASNIVYFGAAKATVLEGSSTSVTVRVPAGATYQPITVTTASMLTAYSNQFFNVTFASDNTGITANSFVKSDDYSVDADPYSDPVAMGDLNKNDKPDIIANTVKGNQIFLNASIPGSVAFSPNQKIESVDSSSFTAIGDLNGDGKLDMAIVNSTAVFLYENSSLSQSLLSFINVGSFLISAGDNNRAEIADLDADGQPDLIVTDLSSGKISMYRNTSTNNIISFSGEQDFNQKALGKISILDLDGDNRPELIIPADSLGVPSVYVWKNTSTNGTFTFSAPQQYTSPIFGNNTYLGDVDGDQNIDIILTGGYEDASVFLNKGNGTGIAFLAFPANIATTSSAGFLSFTDMDGDGKADLCTYDTEVNTFSIYKNRSDIGKVVFDATPINYDVFLPRSGIAGDIDGDGKPDLIIANLNNIEKPSFSVWRNVIPSVLTPPVITSLSSDTGRVGTTLTITGQNFGTDNVVYFGAVKAAVQNASPTSLTVKVPAGTTYQPVTVTTNGLTAYSSHFFSVTFATDGNGFLANTFAQDKTTYNTGTVDNAVAIGDLNTDGKPDVRVAASVSRTFFNNSSLGNISMSAGSGSGNDIYTTTGDVDGDGKLDVIDLTPEKAYIRTAAGVVDSIDRPNFNYAEVADFDADGKPDIILTQPNGQNSNTVFLYRFLSGNLVDTLKYPTKGKISVVDLDGDSKPEIIISRDYVTAVLHNISTPGTFDFSYVGNYSGGGGDTYTGDIDGDGKQDIVVGYNNSVIFILNSSSEGSINFVIPGITYPTSVQASPTGQHIISISDMDGDGKVDLCILTDSGFTVYKNESPTGRIIFANPVTYSSTGPAYTGAAGDIDGDGKADFALLSDINNAKQGYLSIWRNRGSEPSIDSFTPGAATSGSTIQIKGTRLATTTSLTIGGTAAASFTAVSDSVITAVVGSGTVSGNVVVVTSYGTADKGSFSIIPPPVITALSSDTGRVGSTIVITGQNFDTIPANNIVYFGAVQATVTTATTTSLTVRVPAGTTYQPVTVTTNGLTAYSSQFFSVTFATDGRGLSGSTFRKESTEYQTDSYVIDADGISDINNDSTADILLNAYYGIQAFLNVSSPRKVSLQSNQISTNNDASDLLTTGDIDGDGKKDVALLYANSRNVIIYKNATENHSLQLIPADTVALGDDPGYDFIADLDADGRPELIVQAGSTISIYKNTSHDGFISFAQGQDLSQLNTGSISFTDVNGDNRPEMIIPDNDSVLVLLNTSGGGYFNFTRILQYKNPLENGNSYSGDIDGDGKGDIVLSTASAQVVFLNNTLNNNISFISPDTTINTGSDLFAISDLDGDGKVDLCTLTDSGFSIHSSKSSPGNILFNPGVNYKVYDEDYSSNAAAVNDVDGDGRADIVMMGKQTDDGGFGIISIWRNRGSEPTISSFAPDSAGIGSTIQITGSHLFTTRSVFIGGVVASSFIIVSDTLITAVVGSGAASGNVVINTNYGTDTLSGFVILLPPHIDSFTPQSGSPGTVVTITGSHFTGATKVSFGGIAVDTFIVVNDNTITAAVGNGALGYVLVLTPGGVDSLPGFTFIAPPVITDLSSDTGRVGDTIIITGQNFGATSADNIVYFGAVKATVLNASATSLRVTVPAGATYQPVTVTANGLTAYSSQIFSVTFATDGRGFSANTFTKDPATYPTDPIDNDFHFNMAVSDVNGDAKTDLMAGSYFGSQSFLNTSTLKTISLVQDQKLKSGEIISYTATGDLNGDGKTDVVLGNFSSGAINVYENTTQGSSFILNFREDTSFSNGYPNWIGISDLNGDGKPEIIVMSGDIYIFKNTSQAGTLSFASVPVISKTFYGSSLSVTDLNSDNKPEIIVTGADSIYVLQNESTTGEIKFGSKAQYKSQLSPFFEKAIHSGDIDGDGKKDIVVQDSQNSEALLNTSAGNNISFALTSLSAGGESGFLSDMDGDGKVDLCEIATGYSGFSIYKNKSTPGNIAFDTAIIYKTGADSYAAGISDVDGDGRLDFAVINSPGILSIWRNRGSEPTITSFAPDSGRVGTLVLITGTKLASADSVVIGGVKATILPHSTDTLTVTVNTGTASGTITVFTPYGNTITTDSFFIYQPPVITTFTPQSGTQNTQVTIKGSHFSYVTKVFFGGDTAASFRIIDDSTIIATVGSGSPGIITVVSPDGTASSGSPFVFLYPPVIVTFSPDSATANDTVIIRGNYFARTQAVLFGSDTALSFQIEGDTIIRAVVNRGATGFIYVTTAYGTDTSIQIFTYIPPPVIISFTPESGSANDTILIRGSDFTNVKSVTFGGDTALSFQVEGDSIIRAVVKNGANGLVMVTTAYGSGTSGKAFTYIPLLTQIISFSPDSGAAGTQVTIKGYYFTGATQVTIGGTPATIIHFEGDSIIIVTIGAGSTGKIVVTSPAGTDTSDASFKYLPPPSITDFNPKTGASGDTLTITGTDFSPDATVSLGGTPAEVIYINSTLISAIVGTGASGNVIIQTAGGKDTAVDTFKYVLRPAIDSISPDSGFSGTRITISGHHFVPGATQVSLGGIPASVEPVSSDSTTIIVVVGTGATGDVIVKTPAGADTLKAGFTYLPPPAITKFTPSGGTAGDTILITGQDFTNPVLVTFGNVPAVYAVAISRDTIIAIPGSGATGLVFVQTKNGQSLSKDTFTYNYLPVPVITGFTPGSGSTGDVITITGKYFTNSPSVTFGGVGAASVNVKGDTIFATVGAGANGKIVVTTVFGTVTTATDFTYIPPKPKIDSFAPATAFTGIQVTIKGKHLATATKVTLGGTFAEIRSKGSANGIDSIIVIVGNGSSGYVLVETPDGKDSLGGFIYNPCVPAETPVISYFDFNSDRFRGSALQCKPAAKQYRWYFNNTLLENRKADTLSIDKAGFYRVVTTQSEQDTCWIPSLDFPVLVTNQLPDTVGVTLYPNPTTGRFNIDIKVPQARGILADVIIYRVTGGTPVKRFNKLILFGDHVVIPVTDILTKGSYFVQVNVNGDIKIQTIVVL